MKIEFEMTKEDYIQFNLYHFDHSATLRINLILVKYFIAAIIIAIPLIVRKTELWQYLYWFLSFGIILLFWIIGFERNIKKRFVRKIEKFVDEGKTGYLLTQCSIEIGEDEIIETTQYDETRTDWAGIDKFGEDEGYFYIFTNPVRAYIIPKRAFTDKTQEDAFKGFVKNKVSI